jgi:uncharacterized protein
MILPDVNVLVSAFRADSPQHRAHADWLTDVVNGPQAYGMAPQVLASFVRVVTNRRVFVRPSRLDDALSFAGTLLGQPHCQVIQPGARHWPLFVDLCGASKATGNLVADAWFAALAIESGCEWITTDRDYARFAGLRFRPPFPAVP